MHIGRWKAAMTVYWFASGEKTIHQAKNRSLANAIYWWYLNLDNAAYDREKG